MNSLFELESVQKRNVELSVELADSQSENHNLAESVQKMTHEKEFFTSQSKHSYEIQKVRIEELTLQLREEGEKSLNLQQKLHTKESEVNHILKIYDLV